MSAPLKSPVVRVAGIGFSGFRIDAAKHIQPDDLVCSNSLLCTPSSTAVLLVVKIAIFSKLRRNQGGALPDDFITWLEVLVGTRRAFRRVSSIPALSR